MSEPVIPDARVKVLQPITVHDADAVVIADPGVFDAIFLAQMLGTRAYMEAYAAGIIVILHPPAGVS